MNIVVYSLTRDRRYYSQACFASLRARAGVSFRHIVVDNGSTDGTKEWLRETYRPDALIDLPANAGISVASNMALEAAREFAPDLICKIDNDCLVRSENLLGQMAEIFESVGRMAPRYVLSPRVEGITRQPSRGRYTQLAGRRIGLTPIVGGLCHCVPADVYARYRYPETLPPAWGQDDHFCGWIKAQGGEVGYVEGLIVEHFEGTDGQCVRYPEYFERKWAEEGDRK